jgi:hypothetical protein
MCLYSLLLPSEQGLRETKERSRKKERKRETERERERERERDFRVPRCYAEFDAPCNRREFWIHSIEDP